jgi:hypothetical protein
MTALERLKIAAWKAHAAPNYDNLTDLVLAYRDRAAEIEAMKARGGGALRSAHWQETVMDRIARPVAEVLSLPGYHRHAAMSYEIEQIADYAVSLRTDW